MKRRPRLRCKVICFRGRGAPCSTPTWRAGSRMPTSLHNPETFCLRRRAAPALSPPYFHRQLRPTMPQIHRLLLRCPASTQNLADVNMNVATSRQRTGSNDVTGAHQPTLGEAAINPRFGQNKPPVSSRPAISLSAVAGDIAAPSSGGAPKLRFRNSPLEFVCPARVLGSSGPHFPLPLPATQAFRYSAAKRHLITYFLNRFTDCFVRKKFRSGNSSQGQVTTQSRRGHANFPATVTMTDTASR